MIIRRWNLYLINLDPKIGAKPGKTRPAVVIQDDALNEVDHPSTVILPISSQIAKSEKQEFPLRVFLKRGEAGLEKDSVILVDQILAWDNQRFVSEIGRLSEIKIEELKSALRDFLHFA